MVREVVDHFLDPHGIGRRQAALGHQKSPHVGIRGCIHVDRERRKRLPSDRTEMVFDGLIVLFGAGAWKPLRFFFLDKNFFFIAIKQLLKGVRFVTAGVPSLG